MLFRTATCRWRCERFQAEVSAGGNGCSATVCQESSAEIHKNFTGTLHKTENLSHFAAWHNQLLNAHIFYRCCFTDIGRCKKSSVGKLYTCSRCTNSFIQRSFNASFNCCQKRLVDEAVDVRWCHQHRSCHELPSSCPPHAEVSKFSHIDLFQTTI